MKNSRLLLKRILNVCKVGFFIFIITCSFYSCLANAPPAKTGLALGTVCSVNAYEDGSIELYNEIFATLADIEQKMSLTISDSELNMVNKNAGIVPVQVSGELFFVVSRALEYAEISDGAFDPTIGAITSLWNIGKENERVPSATEIDSALDLVNWQFVTLNHENQSIYLEIPGMVLDLGGIAKGYATDEAVKILEKYNVERAIIDFGGNIFAYGYKDKNKKLPWSIGIKNPLQDKTGSSSYPLKLYTVNKAIVTSGPYERYIEQNGTIFHHILNPETGYPTENNIGSVTILSDSALIADAFSTACFVLGKEKSKVLVERGIDVGLIFIGNDKNIVHTYNPADIELTDTTFSINNSIPADY